VRSLSWSRRSSRKASTPRFVSIDRALFTVDASSASALVLRTRLQLRVGRLVRDEVGKIIEPATPRSHRPSVQLGLNLQYPGFRASSKTGPRWHPCSTGDLLVFQFFCCELAACLRHVDGFPVLGLLCRLRPLRRRERRRACPPPCGGRATPEGSTFTFSDGRVRCPAMPLRPRHTYAAVLPVCLPAGDM